MFKFIKRNLIAGILVTLPLVLTAYVLVILFKFADNMIGKFANASLREYLGFYIPGLGIIIILIIIFLVGFLTRLFLGKRLYLILDRTLVHFPLVRHVYPAAKQIVAFLFTPRYHSFKKVVLVEYPRHGLWSLGFITNESFHEAKRKTKKDLLNVFIPSSPGPFTGFFILVPRREIIILDVAIEDAIKLMVSGGLLNPV